MEPDYAKMLLRAGSNPARKLGIVTVHVSTLGGQDRPKWRHGPWISCEIRDDESLARMDDANGVRKVYLGGVLEFVEDVEAEFVARSANLSDDYLPDVVSANSSPSSPNGSRPSVEISMDDDWEPEFGSGSTSSSSSSSSP